jgi:hypothetical protein
MSSIQENLLEKTSAAAILPVQAHPVLSAAAGVTVFCASASKPESEGDNMCKKESMKV